jgi:hypothetical protein
LRQLIIHIIMVDFRRFMEPAQHFRFTSLRHSIDLRKRSGGKPARSDVMPANATTDVLCRNTQRVSE